MKFVNVPSLTAKSKKYNEVLEYIFATKYSKNYFQPVTPLALLEIRLYSLHDDATNPTPHFKNEYKLFFCFIK